MIRSARLWMGLLLISVAGTSLAADQDRPHIVIMLADDLSQMDCTPYGGRNLRTPHMQRLAAAGRTFENAYVVSPSCAPSRAALLTGLMPARNGAEANHSKPRAELKKWPAYFQELGYEVAAFGKVSHYRHTPDYGFDTFAHDAFHDHAGIAAAVRFLQGRQSARPLCLFVGSNWPHVPWPEQTSGYRPEDIKLPEGSIDTPATRLWRARYAAAVTKADDDLGTIMDAVRKTLGERVLFVFSSDHGAQWPFGKWNCYEAGVRVPLLVSWPGVVQAGSRADALVSWVDLLPTLLEAAGGQPSDSLDGRSFLDVLRGNRPTHREAIFTTHSGDGRWNIYPMRAVRHGRWKYIRNLHPEFAFTTHIDLPSRPEQRSFFASWEAAAQQDLDAAAILKRYHERPSEELYDLEVDPHEQRNLAGDPSQAETLQSLRRRLAAWMQEQQDAQTVFAEPRLLSDPHSYGPTAPSGNPAPKPK